MRKIELLVPASSLEVLKIAVVFGADAVYIGGEAFGLRAKAKNFSKEDMAEGIAFAHEHGVKVYVTVNILAHNDDLPGVREYLQEYTLNARPLCENSIEAISNMGTLFQEYVLGQCEDESFFEQASPASGRPCDLVGAPIIPFAYASEEDREVESFPADSCGDAVVETRSRVTDDTLVAGIVGGSFAAPDGFGIVIEVLIQHVSRKNFSCSFRNGDSRF